MCLERKKIKMHTSSMVKKKLQNVLSKARGCTGPEISRSLGSKKWRLTAHEGDKFVSPMHPPPPPPPPEGNIPGTHFCYRLSRPQVYGKENSNDTIGNRNPDLRVCSATALSSAPVTMKNKAKQSTSHPNAGFSQNSEIFNGAVFRIFIPNLKQIGK